MVLMELFLKSGIESQNEPDWVKVSQNVQEWARVDNKLKNWGCFGRNRLKYVTFCRENVVYGVLWPMKIKRIVANRPRSLSRSATDQKCFTPFIFTSMYILNDLLIRVGLALSAMCFQVFPQTACIKRCIVTTVALIWLYFTVHFQVLFQTACVYRGIVTMVAFIWFYFRVRFQMEP